MSTIKVNEVKHQSTADGGVELYNNGDVAIPDGAKVRFDEGDGGTNYVSFEAPTTLSADYTFTLPTSYPAASGYALVSDTSGALSWAEAGGANSIKTDQAATKTSGNLTFNDNVELHFGTGNDVDFFCNGSHMYMDLNSGIGNFYIRDGTTTRFTFNDNGTLTADTFSNGGVRNGIKSSGAGQVGTYALLTSNHNNDKSPGFTTSASNLRWVNCNGNSNVDSISGSWRLMGRIAGQTSDWTEFQSSVWLRYA